MSGSFEETLRQRLEAVRAQGLWRSLSPVDNRSASVLETGRRRLVSFAGNDYLGLSLHPAVMEAGARAVRDWGAGSAASRLISGSLAVHHHLEETLAEFLRTESALGFATGHAAATGVIPALVGPGDVVVVDRLAHACCVDAARLSGAKLRVFRHNDLDDLERILRWASGLPRDASGGPRVLVVTEGVFSMDGDSAPLSGLVELKERHGAWLMLDEAHSTGVLGPEGRGLAAELGLGERIEVRMGTLGKALGASGGFIAGSRALIDLLVNRARSFIFSTAPVPAAAAAATAALGLLVTREVDQARARLRWIAAAGARVVTRAFQEPADSAPPEGSVGHIRPVIVGDEAVAVALAERLKAGGVWVPAIRHPTVARGEARLRLTFSAAHTEADLDVLEQAFHRASIDTPTTRSGGAA
ncbi:MAG: aminotransferase class I/II-fold pyridoxal phosphate-dependent enzyme [Verrucomicrobiota bacterium]